MSKLNNLSDFLKDIADELRLKKKTIAPIPAQNFRSEIANLTSEIKGYTAEFYQDLASAPYVKLIYLDGSVDTRYASGSFNNVVYVCVYEYWSYFDPYYYGATLEEFTSGFWLKEDVGFYLYGICLTGDTMITLSDYSEKRLDELKPSDNYLSYDLDSGKLFIDSQYNLDNLNSRSHAFEKWADRYTIYTFDDGTTIKEVHGHRFFNVTKGEFIYLMFWEIGDEIYKIDGSTPKLVFKETVYEPVKFYSVSTKTHHNGFANGCLYGDRHTQKYEIEFIDGKILQNKNKPTEKSTTLREKKLKQDETKSWIERLGKK